MSRGISCTLAFFAIFFISSASSSSGSSPSSSPDTDTSIESCLRKDSISCVQIHVYKKLRALFSKDTIDLLAGFRLVKDHQDDARSMDVDNEIYPGKNVLDRQSALEDYIYNQVANFFKQRRFSWDMQPAVDQVASTARMVLDNVPKDVKDNFDSYVNEGRGKKKILKSLIPVLVAAKIKMITLLKIALIVIAIIAKKALIISAISIAISIFLLIKKLMHKHHHPHHYEVHGEAYHGSIHHPVSNSGWSNSGWNNGWDSYDSHSSHSQPTAHHMAYSAQKPTLR